MKRRICALVLAMAGVTAVFGSEFSFSVGTGGLLGGLFTRYTMDADGMASGTRIQMSAVDTMDQFNYGFFAFFDATYGVFSVLYQNGANTYSQTADIKGLFGTSSSGRGWESVLGFSLLGKYPFRLGDRLTVFPLLGMDYYVALYEKRAQPDGYVYDRNDSVREVHKNRETFRLSDWNSFWVNLGGGLDFALTQRFFIRANLLYGFRLMTSHETKNLERVKFETGDSDPNKGGLTSGPSLRLCAGYRFYTR
jgi:hypothetical protein